MSRYTGSIDEAAYHEAAHAVAHTKGQVRFDKVTIQPYLDAKNGDWIHPHPVSITGAHRNSYNGLLDDAIICLAAPALAELRYGQYDQVVYAQDIDDALHIVKLATQYKRLKRNTLPPLEEAWERARKFVRYSLWNERINVVAQALLRHTTLNHSDYTALESRIKR